jgi:hypothetical protein
MFSQVDKKYSRAQGGLGVGLSLVKKLVELHGGTVMATSEGEGKGSEFVVRLPAGQQILNEVGRRQPAPLNATVGLVSSARPFSNGTVMAPVSEAATIAPSS